VLCAWGIYLRQNQEYENAAKILSRAKQEADDLSMPQLQAQVDLLLCELYCEQPFKPEQAQQSYQNAIAVLKGAGIQDEDIPYILRKARDELRQRLLDIQTGLIIIREDDIQSRIGIKNIEREVRKQIINRALIFTKGNKGKAAELLKLSRPAFDKACRNLSVP